MCFPAFQLFLGKLLVSWSSAPQNPSYPLNGTLRPKTLDVL